MKSRVPSLAARPFRGLHSGSPVLGRMGSMETRLARSAHEIQSAQRLRYTVFYEELGAEADGRTRLHKRDEDGLDRYCDHLLVLDTNLPEHQQIVGTYRLMDQAAASASGSYYSQSEFNLAPMLSADADKRYLELGRSCIAPAYRSRRTIELMWQGIWSIVLERKIDTLFGCASFTGVDVAEHKEAFSWLESHALVESGMDCPAAASNHFSLTEFRMEAAGDAKRSARAFASLPPLLKGYLRLGAKMASEAVIDDNFGTIDVLVVLDVAQISEKYIAHYGTDASRFAA